MSGVHSISDSHFGHRGIIEFSETKPFRPFATIEEHDAELVRRWNSVVSPKTLPETSPTMRRNHAGDSVLGQRAWPLQSEARPPNVKYHRIMMRPA